MENDELIHYIGAGGRTRSLCPNFDLGLGRWRVTQEYGPARMVWDAAYGYVSGFRKRDIAYYLLTRSISPTIFWLALRWERRHVDQGTCDHPLIGVVGKRFICFECVANLDTGGAR